jgi:hypothetical protein
MDKVACSDLACLQSTPVSTILPAQDATVEGATSLGDSDFIPGVASAEPFRPVVDGTLVKGNLLKWEVALVSNSRDLL